MDKRISIRSAGLDDLDILQDLEERGFSKDRFRPEQFRYLLTKAKASTYIIEVDKVPAGMAVMLWRKKLGIGRLYDIVVDPAIRGQGLGGRLLRHCIDEAAFRKCQTMTLEVRADNHNAIRFYELNHFRVVRTEDDYYHDGSPAIHMIRDLGLNGCEPVRLKVPYYAQTLEFTCGPACLMMAMKYFEPAFEMSRISELNIWKESTLVFMTSGIGGTGPFGLVCAAEWRGFKSALYLSRDHNPFTSSVKKEFKKQVIKLITHDMRDRALKLGVKIVYRNFSLENLVEELQRGYVPIVLVSTYRLHGDRAPHWVVVTGFDREYIYLHDPYIMAYKDGRNRARDIKIAVSEFRKIRKYGSSRFKSVVLIKGKHQNSGKSVKR